jgi:hypothetical protein
LPKGIGCYCASARTDDSGGNSKIKKLSLPKEKTPKGGTKRASAPGRARRQGKSREKLPSVGDVKNDTAGL